MLMGSILAGVLERQGEVVYDAIVLELFKVLDEQALKTLTLARAMAPTSGTSH